MLALESVGSCPVCNCTESQFLFDVPDPTSLVDDGQLKIVRCNTCSLVRLDPRLRQAHLTKVYSGSYWDHNDRISKSGALVEHYRDRLKLLAEYVRPRARILEVGAGNGAYISVLRDYGYAIEGIDLYSGAAKEAKNLYGIELFVGELWQARYPDKCFQAIVMHHVLEHVYSPVQLLEDAYRILADNGIVVIEVPNAASYSLRFFRKFWWGLALPAHVFLYSPATLERLARRVGGFSTIRVTYFSQRHSVVFWQESFTAWFRSLFLHAASEKMTVAGCSSPAPVPHFHDSFGVRLAKVVVGMMSRVLAHLESALKHGAVITVVIEKRPS
jgi:SAM-dependent methyltransferase